MNKNNLRALVALAVSALWAGNTEAQPAPGPVQEQRILIAGATLHVGNGRVYENGALGFANGIITYSGPAINAPLSAFDTVIYANGHHIYPGFIAMNTQLGLVEINAVRSTRDYNEVGTYTPSIRSIIAYNAESEIIATTRPNGVLMGQIVPQGGTVSGSSSLVQFDAWNWEDGVIKADEGIHLFWPRQFVRKRKKDKVVMEPDSLYPQRHEAMIQMFEAAKAYATKKATKTDLNLKALRGLFNGNQTLYVHADHIKDIRSALEFKDKLGIERMILVGGYDAPLEAASLVAKKVSVVLPNPHNLPYYDDDDIDYLNKLPLMLHQSGVDFAFQITGGMSEINVRNLPFNAGTAVANGLPYELAISSLSLIPAKMLGVDSILGSLTEGKKATFSVSQGDILDMKSNKVVHAFVDGRAINLKNKQLDLYQKYCAKFGLIPLNLE